MRRNIWKFVCHELILLEKANTFLAAYFDIHVNEDYGERFFDDSLDSPYRGPPTPDVEKRWSDLHNSKSI